MLLQVLLNFYQINNFNFNISKIYNNILRYSPFVSIFHNTNFTLYNIIIYYFYLNLTVLFIYFLQNC